MLSSRGVALKPSYRVRLMHRDIVRSSERRSAGRYPNNRPDHEVHDDLPHAPVAMTIRRRIQ